MSTDEVKCPGCGCARSRVVETRQPTFHGVKLIIRIRRCEHCGSRYNTKEVVDNSPTIAKAIVKDAVERRAHPSPKKSTISPDDLFPER